MFYLFKVGKSGGASLPLFGWCCFPSPSPLVGAAALDGLAFASFFGAVLRFFPLPAVGGGAFFPLLWVGPSPSPLGGGAFLTSNEWRCFPRLLVFSCASFTSPSFWGGAFPPAEKVTSFVLTE